MPSAKLHLESYERTLSAVIRASRVTALLSVLSRDIISLSLSLSDGIDPTLNICITVFAVSSYWLIFVIFCLSQMVFTRVSCIYRVTIEKISPKTGGSYQGIRTQEPLKSKYATERPNFGHLVGVLDLFSGIG